MIERILSLMLLFLIYKYIWLIYTTQGEVHTVLKQTLNVNVAFYFNLDVFKHYFHR